MLTHRLAGLSLVVVGLAGAALPPAPAEVVDTQEEALRLDTREPAKPWYVHDWDKDCVPCDLSSAQPPKSPWRQKLDAKLRWLDQQDWWARMDWTEREDWLRRSGWDLDHRTEREAVSDAKRNSISAPPPDDRDAARRGLDRKDWWSRMSDAEQQDWLDAHRMWHADRWHRDLYDDELRWLRRQDWWNRLNWMQQEEWLRRHRPWRGRPRDWVPRAKGCGCGKRQPWDARF